MSGVTHPRVISLVPAATELCYRLGIEPIGVSHECDFPPVAGERPSVTSTVVSPDATTEEVNDSVSAGSAKLFDLDTQKIAKLNPDVIIVQGTCSTCALDSSRLKTIIETLPIEPTIETLHVHDIESLRSEILALGDSLDRPARAKAIEQGIHREWRAMGRVGSSRGKTPSVVTIDWLDPVMVAGHWMGEVTAQLGATAPLSDPGEPSAVTPWEAIRTVNPDVFIIAPCGFQPDRTLSEMALLHNRPGFEDIRAVKEEQVFILDGHYYVNRPGPRLIETGWLVAHCLDPSEITAPDPMAIHRLNC